MAIGAGTTIVNALGRAGSSRLRGTAGAALTRARRVCTPRGEGALELEAAAGCDCASCDWERERVVGAFVWPPAGEGADALIAMCRAQWGNMRVRRMGGEGLRCDGTAARSDCVALGVRLQWLDNEVSSND